MKYILSLLTVFILISACNCTSTAKIVKEGNFSPSPSASADEQHKELMKYITARTVKVRLDCTPKEGVIIVGTKYPSLYADGRGSGIIVSSSNRGSYIYTAAHVIQVDNPAEEKAFDCVIYIKKDDSVDSSNKKYYASVFIKNRGKDFAVLRVEENLGVSTKRDLSPYLGQEVWAVGYPSQKIKPGFVTLSITKGTVASLDVPVNDVRGKVHRITSQIYFGSSGGGIWNNRGELIGICNFLLANEEGVPFEGYYYSKPTSEIDKYLIKNNKYTEVFGNVQ